MPLEIRRTARANRDLHDIWAFVARDNPRAADDLIRRLNGVVEQSHDVRFSATTLAEETGLPVLVAEDPLTCVVRGCGIALERMDRMGSIFTSE